MKNNLGMDKIKEIASRITEERSRNFSPLTPIAERIETYKEDETYEVDTNNRIVGCNIAVGDLQFIIRRTVERNIFEIYADDSENGEYGAITIDSHGTMEAIIDFLNQHFNISFYGVSLSSIGEFYKPNNNSKLNQISYEDMETLCCLLKLLELKGIININNDLNGLTDVVTKWNTIQI